MCYKYTIDCREWYQNTLEYWFQNQACFHSLLLLHRKSLLLFLVLVFPICCKLSSLVCYYYGGLGIFLPLFSFFLFRVLTFSVCNSLDVQILKYSWTLWSVENTLLSVFLCVMLQVELGSLAETNWGFSLFYTETFFCFSFWIGKDHINATQGLYP